MNADDAPGHLRILGAYVSPTHNFIEGGQFTIEFDVDAGIDDTDNALTDWCAIVFGAGKSKTFSINALGRNAAFYFETMVDIEVWDGGTRVSGGGGDFPGGIPKGEFHVRIDASTDNFRGGSPATIRMFINNTEVHIGAGDSLGYTKNAGFKANYITLESTGSWANVFDNFSVSSIPCIGVSPLLVENIPGQTSDAVTVTVPKQVNATTDADITVTSQSPSIAIPTGADSIGQLKLHFTAGGPTTQTYTVNALAIGSTVLSIAGAPGVCVDNPLRVHVADGIGLSEVVFSDTFDASANNWDINFENDKRQSGTASPLVYNETAGNLAGGATDDSSQVANDLAPGKLFLQVANGLVWASPSYNFLEGGNYKIEFEVNPSLLDPDRTTDDWTAVVFGATSQGAYVNGSDGMGILFRSNGGIEAFDGSRLIFDQPAGTLPSGELKIRIEIATPDFTGSNPAIISLFVNDVQLDLADNGTTFTKLTGFKGNFVTLEGYAAAANTWAYAFDNLKISALASVPYAPPANAASSGTPKRLPSKSQNK